MSLMSTLGITTIGGAAIGTAVYTTDDNGINKEKRNHVLATTLASTATVIASEAVSQHGMKEIHEKYSQAYLDSLTDEELEAALQQVNLLINDMDEDTVKTIYNT